MFRTHLVHAISREERNITFFPDDSIQAVREQASRSTDIHPDRLFLLIGIRLSRNYYIRDPRNWEALFTRISLNGQPIPKETFESYCREYRIPALHHLQMESMDKETWMSYPPELRDIFEPPGDFVEYRILGVSPEKSYCMPWSVSMQMSSRIPSAQLPIPEGTRIFTTFYKPEIVHSLVYIPHEKDAPAYYPLLRSVTPARMTVDELQRIVDTSKKLEALLKLDPPAPTKTNILRARWYITLVDTEFGDAIRARFEQIFYGITLSKTTPCITYYTSDREVSRHKFYTEDVKQKTPFLDIPMWNAWWSVSKPSRRNRPTLVLYRGTSRENYDRVSISYSDITFSVYRDAENTETLDEMRNSIKTWFETLDAITPFVNTRDVADCRWELQMIDFSAKYKHDLEELDIRRLSCISFLFTTLDIRKSAFRFLRADAVDEGLSPTEFRVLQMMREDPGISVDKLDFLTSQEAEYILIKLNSRLEEDPDLLERSLTPFPIVRFTPDRVYVKSSRALELPLRYINILRFILSDPKSKELDAICPKRLESVEAERTFIPTAVVEDTDEFADIFAQLEDVPVEEIRVEPATQEKVQIAQKTGTMHRYFVNRLQQFDPVTFKGDNVKEYSKHCDQGHQPSVLTDEELKSIVEEYDPRTYLEENQMMSTEKGLVFCPEYWCMYDRIPLRESQLIMKDGILTCPICGGKLQTTKADPREFPVIRRLKGFVYPGMKTYTSSSGDVKNMPCCFKTPRTQKLKPTEKEDEKYYIVGETKTGLKQYRLAYLPQSLMNGLKLKLSYKELIAAQNRIASNTSGYFRVGIGRPSETLPSFLGLKTTIPPPKENVNRVMQCSFFPSWQTPNDRYVDEIIPHLTHLAEDVRMPIAKIISGIHTAFETSTLTPIQELEYSALTLKTNIYRFLLTSNTMACTFFTQMNIPKTRAIVVLQRDDDIDILAYATRAGRTFSFKANIYDPPFTQEQHQQLFQMNSYACATDIPTATFAILASRPLIPEFGDDIQVVLDPYGRSQALFFPGKMILPFLSSAMIDVVYPKVSGYSAIRDRLPTKDSVMHSLSLLKPTYGSIYEYESDVYDGDGNIVEIMLKNGLRIPVVPVASGKPETENTSEMPNILSTPESVLTFGERNKEQYAKYKDISYASEIFNYLIFELTKDIERDRHDLGIAIKSLEETKIEPLLSKWFESAIESTDVPVEFLSKVRVPCGQFTQKNLCEKANMCAWNGSSCRIKVRKDVSKPALFRKLLHALVENSKLRAMVLEGRTTPFFSTILYMELPHEIILTDLELKSE